MALLLQSGRRPVSAARELLSACIAGVADDPGLGVGVGVTRRFSGGCKDLPGEVPVAAAAVVDGLLLLSLTPDKDCAACCAGGLAGCSEEVGMTVIGWLSVCNSR